MPTMTKTNRTYRVTPAFGVAIGLIYLIGFSVGGQNTRRDARSVGRVSAGHDRCGPWS
jgi:hypothetical protein